MIRSDSSTLMELSTFKMISNTSRTKLFFMPPREKILTQEVALVNTRWEENWEKEVLEMFFWHIMCRQVKSMQ